VQKVNAAIQKNLDFFVGGVNPFFGDPAHLLAQMIKLDRLTNFTQSDPKNIMSYFQKIEDPKTFPSGFYTDPA
jgi:hypothetical protein